MVYNWEDDPEMTGQRKDFEESVYKWANQIDDAEDDNGD